MLNVMVKVVGLIFAPILLLASVMLKLITGIMRLILIPIAVALIVSLAVSAVRMLMRLHKHNKHHLKEMECLWEDLSRKMHKPKKEAVKVEVTDAGETKAEESKAEAKVEETKEQPSSVKASDTTKERGSTKAPTGAGT
jgi:low affinity Fe/Cu permease